jgi:hypothetical protein
MRKRALWRLFAISSVVLTITACEGGSGAELPPIAAAPGGANNVWQPDTRSEFGKNLDFRTVKNPDTEYGEAGYFYSDASLNAIADQLNIIKRDNLVKVKVLGHMDKRCGERVWGPVYGKGACDLDTKYNAKGTTYPVSVTGLNISEARGRSVANALRAKTSAVVKANPGCDQIDFYRETTAGVFICAGGLYADKPMVENEGGSVKRGRTAGWLWGAGESDYEKKEEIGRGKMSAEYCAVASNSEGAACRADRATQVWIYETRCLSNCENKATVNEPVVGNQNSSAVISGNVILSRAWSDPNYRSGVRGNRALTRVYFQVSESSDFTNALRLDVDAIEYNAQADRLYSANVTGLKPATTYYYRIIGSNLSGDIESEYKTFEIPRIVCSFDCVPIEHPRVGTVTPGGAVFPPSMQQNVSQRIKLERYTVVCPSGAAPCSSRQGTSNQYFYKGPFVTAQWSGVKLTAPNGYSTPKNYRLDSGVADDTSADVPRYITARFFSATKSNQPYTVSGTLTVTSRWEKWSLINGVESRVTDSPDPSETKTTGLNCSGNASCTFTVLSSNAG